MMMNQELKPKNAFMINDIEDESRELIFTYKLQAGRHYSLNIFYLGKLVNPGKDKHICVFYDLMMSITSQPNLALETQCGPKDETPSFARDIPKTIQDRDLDSNGEYHFDKLLRLANPDDFRGYQAEKVGEVANNRYFKKGQL